MDDDTFDESRNYLGEEKESESYESSEKENGEDADDEIIIDVKTT